MRIDRFTWPNVPRVNPYPLFFGSLHSEGAADYAALAVEQFAAYALFQSEMQ